MPHINDLPASVLVQILHKAAAAPANRLSQWKAKLPLLAVCRTWTKLVIGAMFYQVYVELPELPDSTSSAHFLWISNTELFIARGCVLKARRLTVELSYDVNPNQLRFIALDILKLDRVDWQNINSLAFTLATWTIHLPVESVPQDKRAATDVARTVLYFSRSLRNIVELDLCSLASESAGEYLYSNLATFYGGRLQALRAEGFIMLPFTCIPRNIKALSFTLDSEATHVLPSIHGETLRVLKLDNVPHNFAWHHFRYDLFSRPIVFRQLTILHLSFEIKETTYTEGEIQDKIASGARCCDQLCFPALRQLVIDNCTPDCDLLYTDLPFPKLKKVDLLGSINSIRHCSRLKLTWVRDLSVVIFSDDSDDTPAIYRLANHLFTNIRIGRTASLSISGDWFVLDPDVMRWANLTQLEVNKGDYDIVCKAIGRLSNLCELTIHSLATSSSIEDLSLFTSVDPMLAWGERLAILIIPNFEGDCPLTALISDIQVLIRRAVTLKVLTVPESAIQDVTTFIDMYKDRHPHLANIQLLNDAEIFFE
ncbi:hypothetical protein GGH94_000063 [Coemansia aciculifera]|uniref:F-box domain-containing protein n=1 Tax=Coemansia aciculifera TaxID=417176 RepID=A0A9W8IWS1_9FUNG|nr:hypothetical protein GGH94_000063 [Coemansia aciculifera]KAJ2877305.1 hypothetical protein GGH93_000046 [Coemansia aciculifera]